MIRYNFYDTDPMGCEEYDIAGSDYCTLLETCFHYCTTFSLLVDLQCENSSMLIANLEKYRLPVTDEVRHVYDHYGQFEGDKLRNYEIRHYDLTDTVKREILAVTDSIFKWICGWGYNNPADPAFYREDGSVFFCSLIHEGVCTLSPREGEDVEQVIGGKMWIPVIEG